MDNIRYAFNIYYYYTIASVSLNAIYYSYQGTKFIKYGNNLYYKLVSKNNDDEEIEEIEEEFDILENIKIINELEMT